MEFAYVSAVPSVNACYESFNVYKLSTQVFSPEKYWGDSWIIKAPQSFYLRPNEFKLIETGLYWSIPSRCLGSLVTFHEMCKNPPHFHVATTVIFPDYTHECQVPLLNKLNKTIFISKGENLALFELFHYTEIDFCGKEASLYIDYMCGYNVDKNMSEERKFLCNLNNKFKRIKDKREMIKLTNCGLI